MGIREDVEDVMKEVKKITKRGFWSRAFDGDDSSVSMASLFLAATTIIGLILLLVPVAVVIVDLYFSHTVNVDMSDMAAYVTSVTALFASGGITKAWTTWANYKYNGKNCKKSKNAKNCKKVHAVDIDDDEDEDDFDSGFGEVS